MCRYFARRDELFEKLAGIYGERPVFPPLTQYAHAIYRSLHNFYSMVDPSKLKPTTTWTPTKHMHTRTLGGGALPTAAPVHMSIIDLRALADALSKRSPKQQAAFNAQVRAHYGEVPISPPLTVPQHSLYVSLRQFYLRYNPAKLREALALKHPSHQAGGGGNGGNGGGGGGGGGSPTGSSSSSSSSSLAPLDLIHVCRQCADDPPPAPSQPYSNKDARKEARQRHFQQRKEARARVFSQLQARCVGLTVALTRSFPRLVVSVWLRLVA